MQIPSTVLELSRASPATSSDDSSSKSTTSTVATQYGSNLQKGQGTSFYICFL